MSYKRKIPYNDRELIVKRKKSMFFGGEMDIYDTPVTYRENFIAHYCSKEPWFVASNMDTVSMRSSGYQKNLSRPFFEDSVDCFGVPWKWVKSAGGAITPGGNPVFDDANEWRDKISIPDIDNWNWEEDAKAPLDPEFALTFTFLNGFWFERLISLMDFENAAMALVDPDQTDAIKDLFESMTDLGIKLVDKFCEYWPRIDGFQLHDDWGSQKNPFFSENVARTLFLPYMKELVSHIHSKGRFVTIHSCGHVEDRIGIFIEAGIDGWQLQNMNDIKKLYDEVGDKIVLEAWPDPFDINDEKASIEAARGFVDRFCKSGKTVLLGNGFPEAMKSKVFLEELYSYSRKHFSSI